MEKGNHLARLYLAIVLLLLGAGVVMVFSASSVSANYDSRTADSAFFLRRHIIFLVVGVIGMIALSRFNYRLLLKSAIPLYILTIALLLAVLVGGEEINNAKRWLRLGPLQFQPSELAKFAVIIGACAYAIQRGRDAMASFKSGFLPACGFLLPLCGLILVEPDLGTALFVATIAFLLLIAGGMSMKHVLATATLLLPFVIAGMYFKFGHVQDRILVFLDPEADKLGKGHQIYQSLIALGSGGFFGQGIGASTQKLFFLPEEHTDFIFAIFVEEAGFVGGAAIILLFLALLHTGWRISKRAPDRFSAMLVLGFTGAIVLQAAMNIAVVTASVPTKGISLPFISYGGTGLITALAGVGVVLNVARQALGRTAAASLWAREIVEEAMLRDDGCATGLAAH